MRYLRHGFPLALVVEAQCESHISVASLCADRGFGVVCAESESEAAAAIEEAGGRVSLIIINREMPDDSARALGERLRARANARTEVLTMRPVAEN